MRTRILTAVLLAALSGTGVAIAEPPPAPVAPVGPLVDDPRHADHGILPTVVCADPDYSRIPKFWADVDYLLYWISPGRYPQPFLTTSPTASLGVLGQAGTQVVIGGDVDYGTHNGLRLYSGCWWNADSRIGSDGEVMYFEQRAKGFSAVSDGTTLLARPLINALNGSQASSLIAFPGAASGSLVVESRERFANGDGNLIFNLVREDSTWVNALLGFRYIYFREEVRAIENQQFLADGFGQFQGVPVPAGATMVIQDRFETVNNLYLAQIGLRGETMRGPISLTGHAKVGIGWANERTFVDGRTSVGAVTVPGGVLAQTTIPYRNYNDQFVVVPEIGGQIGYQFGQRWRLSAGYNLLYVSNVARPGLQIDPIINPNLVVSSQQFGTAGGPALPTWRRNTTDLIVHGINLGVTYRY